MGLEKSEHIGKIVVDPRDGNVVYVAAEGPLWAAGGERGLYKTTDGGETWSRSLHIDDDTGITDVELDPRDPDVLYAASYHDAGTLVAYRRWSGIGNPQVHRRWRNLAHQARAPQGGHGQDRAGRLAGNPDVVYATIEADEKESGFYRSRDRGESWEQRNEYISNGTGPHYYQEIDASPHDVDLVYQMDVFLHVTRDGGSTFDYLGTGVEKHSDNHALVIDPADPDHLIAGTDGGIYETFDHGAKWRHTRNLPVAQFYKLGLSTEEPFYNILGGAQDMGTLLGPPVRTAARGFAIRIGTCPWARTATPRCSTPSYPNLLYIEWQGGRLYRYDRASEEALDIQPQPEPGDAPERFNWDAPIITSAHSPSRIYFGSQRVWRSDDRGDSWTAVSGDLTSDPNRYELEVAGRVHSVDSLWDHGAMSWYGTLTTIAESPLDEALLYAGSDDGLIQVSENGGGDWRRAAPLPGVPERAFVNDLRASLHDADTVFAAVDNHKTGDYRPLLFKSEDRGRSWTSIAGDLEDGALAWAIVEDHVAPDLLFAPPSGVCSSRLTVAAAGSSSPAAFPRSPSATSRSNAARTTSSAPPSGAASSSSTTTPPCATSPPAPSTATRRCSRSATPGGTSRSFPCRPPASRARAARISRPRIRRSARCSRTSWAKRRRPGASCAAKKKEGWVRKARTFRSRAGTCWPGGAGSACTGLPDGA